MLNRDALRRSRPGLRQATLVAAWLLVASMAGAQSERVLAPPGADGPTVVFTDIYGVEILEVDPRAETFLVEADLVGTWTDPRLAGSPDRLVFQNDAALEALKTQIWWPGLELSDAKGSRDRMHIDLTGFPDGSVFYRERFLATVKQNFDLSSFPGAVLAMNPEAELSITMELVALSLEEINHLWGALGGKQLPFVAYRGRLVVLEEDRTIAGGGDVREVTVVAQDTGAVAEGG